MKLDRLKIRDFKNLRGIDVDFDETSLSTIVVGQNGTGKSNLLEALVLIFKALDLKKAPPFDYELAYECRGRQIVVRAESSGFRRQYQFLVAESGDAPRPVTRPEFYEEGPDGHPRNLPRHVFGYYSGPSNRLEEHFDEHQALFYRDLLEDRGGSRLRRLFYSRLAHSQFVLLAFFSGLGDRQDRFLAEYLGIEALESVLFVLNEPGWGRTARFRDFRWFWKAQGVVRGLLDRLYAQGVALAPLFLRKEAVPTGLSRIERRDHVFLYVPSERALATLAAHYGSQQEFFAALESAYISELIREVRVKARVVRGGTISFRELSEGEQQLLMVLGLLKFTQEAESLFLLDEPDTHLNPNWSIQYLEILERVVGKPSSCHFVVTTHNPLLLAGLRKEQVQVMTRDGRGHVQAQRAATDPRGMGVSGLLTSELFGLRSELDLATLRLLDEKRLLGLRDDLGEADLRRLAQINSELEHVGLMEEDRDPLFTLWSRAMAQVERDLCVGGAGLSRQQRESLASRGQQLVEELIRASRDSE